MDVLSFLQHLFALPVKLLLVVLGLLSVIIQTVFFLVELVFSYLNTIIELCPSFLRPFVILIFVIRLLKFLMKRGNSPGRSSSSDFSSVSGVSEKTEYDSAGSVVSNTITH